MMSSNQTTYTFTEIANTEGDFDSLGSPAINEDGTIVFAATLDDGSAGVFTSDGQTITTIVETDDSFDFDTFGEPVINSDGTVAFTASKLDEGNAVIDSAIFTASGGELTTLVEDGDRFAFFQPQPDINDSGTVAFIGNPPGEFDSFFTVNADGEISTVVTAIDNDQSINVFGSRPQINNSGTVAFSAFLEDNTQATFTNADGSISRIIDDSGEFSFVSYPNLNNNGSIAFYGSLDNGSNGIFRYDADGNIVTIADDSDSLEFDFNDLFPAINDDGTVAFTAELAGVGDGIFINSDSEQKLVIAEGDLLSDSTVENIGCCTEGLNNSGQIVFNALLEDGSVGIFRADPQQKVRDDELLSNGKFGTPDDDILQAGLDFPVTNKNVFAGAGDDWLDLGASQGGNRVFGGSGEDTFILGTNDFVLGGDDGDRFFFTSGGENVAVGTAGADQFWIASAEIPDSINVITDYELGADVIGIAGLGVGFDDLNLKQVNDNTVIAVQGRDLAILLGIQGDTLSVDNFVFV
ncbi:MAG: hypothetical protein Tsb0014_28320 [Pleurocapsa sp.]